MASLLLLLEGGVAMTIWRTGAVDTRLLISLGVGMASALCAMICTGYGARHNPLSEERRAWRLIQVGVWSFLLFTLYGLLCRVLWGLAPVPLWSIILFVAGHLLLWIGLLFSGGHFPKTLPERLAICWDLLLLIVATGAIASFLPLHPGVAHLPWRERLITWGVPVANVLTLVVVTLQLSRIVPRALQGPRALTAAGVLLVFCGDYCYLLELTGKPVALLMRTICWSAGYVILGLAALWQATRHRDHSDEGLAEDGFPSLLGHTVPAVLLIATITYSCRALLHAPSFATAHARDAFLALLALLALLLVRLLIAGWGNRNAYRELHERFVENAKLSLTDPLTGLSNQRYFRDRLQEEMSRATRYGHAFSIILCDI
ncbi:MAG TPA: diguanylate cyclase, partial [Armatimonadota bacterium]